VSRAIDLREALNLSNEDNDDEEGLDTLEVAHILPHSLMKVNANHELVRFAVLQAIHPPLSFFSLFLVLGLIVYIGPV
jgi:hypothetical protein